MDMTTVEIRPAEGVADVMEERGVNLDDVREILVYAEGEAASSSMGTAALPKSASATLRPMPSTASTATPWRSSTFTATASCSLRTTRNKECGRNGLDVQQVQC